MITHRMIMAGVLVLEKRCGHSNEAQDIAREIFMAMRDDREAEIDDRMRALVDREVAISRVVADMHRAADSLPPRP